MTLTNVEIEFLHRFFNSLFEGAADCLYISDNSEEETELILSRDCGTALNYSMIQHGVFEGVAFNSYYGCTKIVFFFEGWDVVIKIPFNGCFYYDYDTEDIVYIDMPNHICIEDDLYEQASNELKKILLKNYYLFSYGNLEIYAQAMVDKTAGEVNLNYYWESLSENIKDKVNGVLSCCDSHCHAPSYGFLATIVMQHPNDFYDLLPEICQLDDLHNENYGYLTDGTAVILDYAGYTECWD